MKRAVQVDIEAMSRGYLEMSEINSTIANDFFEVEEEGWSLFNEMDTEEAS